MCRRLVRKPRTSSSWSELRAALADMETSEHAVLTMHSTRRGDQCDLCGSVSRHHTTTPEEKRKTEKPSIQSKRWCAALARPIFDTAHKTRPNSMGFRMNHTSYDLSTNVFRQTMSRKNKRQKQAEAANAAQRRNRQDRQTMEQADGDAFVPLRDVPRAQRGSQAQHWCASGGCWR